MHYWKTELPGFSITKQYDLGNLHHKDFLRIYIRTSDSDNKLFEKFDQVFEHIKQEVGTVEKLTGHYGNAYILRKDYPFENF